MRTSLRRESGLSLVEATIILMVLAILAAAAAPSIDAYVSDARQSRAREDGKVIGAAIARFMADTGEDFFLQNGNGGGTAPDLAAPSHAAANLVKLLVTDGDIPSKSVARSAGTPDWDSVRDEGSTALVQSLALHLVTNSPSAIASRNYRTPTNMTSMSTRAFDPVGGATYNAEFGWRGPYLSGPIESDPWGRRYAVNVEFLAHLSGSSTPSGNTNDVFVLSAGPDGETDTRFDIDGATAGDDDVIVLLQGGSR